MSAPLRYVAPAGAPIRVGDLARWARLSLSGRDAAEALQQAIGDRFGARHSVLTCTGRAGLTLLLKAMRRLAGPERTEVVLPTYTCFSVAASVVKAGLRPRLVDISPDTLDYAPDRLAAEDFSRVLAIIATNLYGLPNDLPALDRIARERGVFLIDDAAQAMGASVGGRLSGTWGDAGLFSFDKGKNVSAIDGGVVVTNSDDLAGALRAEVANAPEPAMRESAAGVAKALAYFLLLRPGLYWMPNRIPQLELGKTVFTTDFPLERSSPALTALAAAMVARLDEFTGARTANAAALLDGLNGVSGIRTTSAAAGARSVYLRLPILVSDADRKERLARALNGSGIGASGSYPASLADVPELRGLLASPADAAGGRYVARHILTLPTHPFVTRADVDRMVAAAAASVDAADGGRLGGPVAAHR